MLRSQDSTSPQCAGPNCKLFLRSVVHLALSSRCSTSVLTELTTLPLTLLPLLCLPEAEERLSARRSVLVIGIMTSGKATLRAGMLSAKSNTASLAMLSANTCVFVYWVGARIADPRSNGLRTVEPDDLPDMSVRWAVKIGRTCAGIGMYVLVRDPRWYKERRMCKCKGWYRFEGMSLMTLRLVKMHNKKCVVRRTRLHPSQFVPMDKSMASAHSPLPRYLRIPAQGQAPRNRRNAQTASCILACMLPTSHIK